MSLESGGESTDPWSDEELLITAHENLGVGADAGLHESVRFLSGVVRVIKKRIARASGDEPFGDPAVFLLSPSVPVLPSDLVVETVPMLDNGITAIGGRIWFVGPVAAAGKAAVLSDWDDAAVFELIAEELGVGSVPSVLYETRGDVPSARYYPHGLSEPEVYSDVRLSGAGVKLSEIIDVIDHVHRELLVTPTAQSAARQALV